MSHDTHTEWISIGDFMAGIVGILVLFFVIAVLLSVSAKADAEAKRMQGVQKVMQSLKQSISKSGVSGIELLTQQGVIRLKDSSFAKGSACLDQRIRHQLEISVAPLVREAMLADKSLSIQIEGHSDSLPVGSGSSNTALVCAPFDDNYTLSAGRAREARKALMVSMDVPEIVKRISVVGFGPDRLLNPSNPDSAENRRVEVRFVVAGQ